MNRMLVPWESDTSLDTAKSIISDTNKLLGFLKKHLVAKAGSFYITSAKFPTRVKHMGIIDDPQLRCASQI